PPLAADKKRLRVLQDDLVRAHEPRIHPVAEVTLGGLTGWENWVTGDEFDQSTRLDQPPYTRAAMRDLVRGLYDGGGTLTPATGTVEIGIVYTHHKIHTS